ncbi:MAG: hypothetical protein IPG90_21205 [Bacteroidetes bacterium]|nr:hypothetical protein [Bacteroidota bacterium]
MNTEFLSSLMQRKVDSLRVHLSPYFYRIPKPLANKLQLAGANRQYEMVGKPAFAILQITNPEHFWTYKLLFDALDSV